MATKTQKLPVPARPAKQVAASAANGNGKNGKPVNGPKAVDAEARKGTPAKAAPAKAKPALDETGGNGIPAFLDRTRHPDGRKMTPAEIRAAADLANEKANRSRTVAPAPKAALKATMPAAGVPVTKAQARAIAKQAVAENGVTKVSGKGRNSPGYARLQASGKAEKLQKETAAMQEAATLKGLAKNAQEPKAKAKKQVKVAKVAKAKPKAAPKAKADGPSKSDTVKAMLASKKGATRAEIVAAVDWPSINLKPIAARMGKKLVQDKEGRFRAV